MLSKETVQQRYKDILESDDVKRPFDEFDLNHKNLTVKLGSCVFRYSKCLILLDGVVVLAIEPPEEDSYFPVLSGCFSDSHGNELFRIGRNEWQGTVDAWDAEIKGNEILIRTSSDETALYLRVTPPETIEVVELNMRIGQCHLVLKEDALAVGRIKPDAEYYIGIESLECLGADIGVCVDSENTPCPQFTGFSIIGGEGINLQGTGIKLAVGSASMSIKGIRIEDTNKVRTIISEFPLTTSLHGKVTEYLPRL